MMSHARFVNWFVSASGDLRHWPVQRWPVRWPMGGELGLVSDVLTNHSLVSSARCPGAGTDQSWPTLSWPIGTHLCPCFLTTTECSISSWQGFSYYSRIGSQLRITRLFECCPIFVISEICFRWPHYSLVSNVGRLRGPAAILCFGSLGPDPGLANCL